MRVELYPDTDTLSISFLAPGTVAHEGTDSGDPDVTFLWDGQGRIAEIVIEGPPSAWTSPSSGAGLATRRSRPPGRP